MMERLRQAMGLTCAIYFVMLCHQPASPSKLVAEFPHLNQVSSSLASMIALLWDVVQQDT